MKRENIIGRANVEDTPELERYYQALEGEALGALWNVANEIEPWYPQPKSVPAHWRWRELRPHVMRSLELVTGDDAGRRVVMLVNPGRRDISAAVGLLYTGLQIMNPGESMSAHRHAAKQRSSHRPRASNVLASSPFVRHVVCHEVLHLARGSDEALVRLLTPDLLRRVNHLLGGQG